MKRLLLGTDIRCFRIQHRSIWVGIKIILTEIFVFSFIFIMLLMGACGTLPSEQGVTETATSMPTFTPAALPTSPDVLPPTVQLTSTALSSQFTISTSLEEFILDSLRMFYIRRGKLYVQDGNDSPKRLPNSEEDVFPVFLVSDDGKKIVFYYGKTKDDADIFSIDADGSHEQKLLTKDWLAAFGEGTKMSKMMFIPNTHQLLFNTYLCPEDFSFACIVGFYLADTDTGRIKEIMPPSSGRNLYEYGNFTPFELYPRIFWLADSSGLIVALPDEIEYSGAWASEYPPYAIWKYTFNSNLATQIPLKPAPTWMHAECNDVISISPDGSWVVYFTDNYEVYGGNLLDGSTQPYLSQMDCSPTCWSSDNRHFLYGGRVIGGPILGSVDSAPASIPGYFWGWIDAKRYIYSNLSYPIKDNIQILVGEISGKIVLIYQSNISIPDIYPYSFTFTILNGN